MEKITNLSQAKDIIANLDNDLAVIRKDYQDIKDYLEVEECEMTFGLIKKAVDQLNEEPYFKAMSKKYKVKNPHQKEVI